MFSLIDMKAPFPQWREAHANFQTRRNAEEESGPTNAKRADAAVCTVRPPFAPVLYCAPTSPLFFISSIWQNPLRSPTLVNKGHVRPDTADYSLDLMRDMSERLISAKLKVLRYIYLTIDDSGFEAKCAGVGFVSAVLYPMGMIKTAFSFSGRLNVCSSLLLAK